MRATLAGVVLLCHFLTAQSAFSAPKSTGKYTVCSVTINSKNEIDTFKKVLGTKNFNFVELTANKPKEDELSDDDRSGKGLEPEWIDESCKKKIRCDILVVSGHFGGKFFSEDSNSELELGMEDLEVAACDQRCKATIQAPKEVFLFGCNTLAGKNADFRTPERYREDLLRHNFSHETAEQMVAFRYSQFGDSFAARMAGVFRDTPRIYGFDSSGPSGRNVQQMLMSYLKKAEATGYYSQGKFMTAGSSTNSLLKEALRSTSLVQAEGLGKQNYQSAVCYLHDPRISAGSKLKFVEEALMGPNMLAHLPYINTYLGKFLKGNRYDDSEGEWDDRNFERFENVAKFAKAKEVMDEMISKNFDAILSMQMSALRFQSTMGWISPKVMNSRSVALLLGNDRTNWTLSRRDTVRSILPEGLRIDMPLRDLPQSKFTDQNFLDVLKEIPVYSSDVVRRLIELSNDPSVDPLVRSYAERAVTNYPSTPEARDYVVKKIKEAGGIERLKTILYYRGSNPENRMISEALAVVVKNGNFSMRKRADAFSLFRPNGDEKPLLEESRSLLREMLEAFYRNGKIEDMDSRELCLYPSIVGTRIEKLILSKLEVEALAKIGMQCPEGQGSAIFEVLKSQDLSDDIWDALIAKSLRSRRVSFTAGTTLYGMSFERGRVLNVRNLPNSAKASLEHLKSGQSGQHYILEFALGSDEGQALLMNNVEKADFRGGWELVTRSALSDANRIRLVERLMKGPKDQVMAAQLFLATTLSPSLAGRYLKIAIDGIPTSSVVGLNIQDMPILGAYMGNPDFLKVLVQIADDPLTSESSQRSATHLLAFSRPNTLEGLNLLRQLSRNPVKSPNIREASKLALFVVGDASVSEDEIESSLFPSKFAVLKWSHYEPKLAETAIRSVQGPTGFLAMEYLTGVPAVKDRMPSLTEKFVAYQLTHHDRAKEFTKQELSLISRLSDRQLVRPLEKLVRFEGAGTMSLNNVLLAASVAQGDSPAAQLCAKFIRTSSWTDFAESSGEWGDNIDSSTIREALVDRLVTAVTADQVGVFAYDSLNIKKLSLKQNQRVKAFHAKQTDPKMIKAVRNLWPSGRDDD